MRHLEVTNTDGLPEDIGPFCIVNADAFVRELKMELLLFLQWCTQRPKFAAGGLVGEGGPEIIMPAKMSSDILQGSFLKRH